MAESQESSVQLSGDASSNKNLIRMVAVIPPATYAEWVSTCQVPLQEVIALADAQGNFLGVVDGGSLQTADDQTRMLLLAVVNRLDLLIHAIDEHYEPPDDLGLGEEL
jgi:hypothetical protein